MAVNQEFAGKVRACPSCGKDIGSFTALCPACDFEFMDLEPNNAMEEFKDKIINGHDEAVSEAGLRPGARLRMRFKKGSGPGGLGAEGREWNAIDDRDKSLVEGYIVPADRETLLEFVFFIYGHIVPARTPWQEKWNTIWRAKLKQTLDRATQLMSDDPATLAFMKDLATECGVTA